MREFITVRERKRRRAALARETAHIPNPTRRKPNGFCKDCGAPLARKSALRCRTHANLTLNHTKKGTFTPELARAAVLTRTAKQHALQAEVEQLRAEVAALSGIGTPPTADHVAQGVLMTTQTHIAATLHDFTLTQDTQAQLWHGTTHRLDAIETLPAGCSVQVEVRRDLIETQRRYNLPVDDEIYLRVTRGSGTYRYLVSLTTLRLQGFDEGAS